MKVQLLKFELERILLPLVILMVTVLTYSCKNDNKQEDGMQIETDTTAVDTTANNQMEVRTFSGNISSLNTELNGEDVTGKVAFRIEGDLMRFTVTAEGLAPEMMHVQHLQTSETGGATNCPGSNADANNDGIIDVTEVSRSAEGIRMIPLHMGPSSLEMNVDTYPKSNVNGELQFSRTVSLDSLRTAVRENFGMQDVDFTQFTYVIQGVAEDASIPQSAQNVTGIPMHQTIPVGCAKLEEE